MYSGKLTFSTPSTHKKSCKVLEGEENIRQMHTSRKNSQQMNGLEKTHAYNNSHNPPFPCFPWDPQK